MTRFYVAAHALIARDGRYLVTRRSVTEAFMPSKWDLPGGTVEAGETVEDALLREVTEETSLSVEVVRPLYAYTDLASLPARQTVQVVYLARHLRGEVSLDPGAHDEFRWASKEDLAGLDSIPFLSGFRKSPAYGDVA